jgi:hypothetical protein
VVLDQRHIVSVPLKPNLYDTNIVNASLALFIATLMVFGAIAIVNITIFQLRIHASERSSFTLIETAGIISHVSPVSSSPWRSCLSSSAASSHKTRTSIREHLDRITSKERGALNTYDDHDLAIYDTSRAS